MWLYGKTDPQSYPVDLSILRLGLNKDEHPSRCVPASAALSENRSGLGAVHSPMGQLGGCVRWKIEGGAPDTPKTAPFQAIWEGASFEPHL